jgi:hypothetical protein
MIRSFSKNSVITNYCETENAQFGSVFYALSNAMFESQNL